MRTTITCVLRAVAGEMQSSQHLDSAVPLDFSEFSWRRLYQYSVIRLLRCVKNDDRKAVLTKILT